MYEKYSEFIALTDPLLELRTRLFNTSIPRTILFPDGTIVREYRKEVQEMAARIDELIELYRYIVFEKEMKVNEQKT